MLGIGFWFGFSRNLGLPGGRILEKIGIPDFRDEVIQTRNDVEFLEQLLKDMRIDLAEAEKALAEFRGEIGPGDPLPINVERLKERIAVREVELAALRKKLQRLRISQGLVLAIWFILLKYGILKGIGEIIPL